MNFTGIIYKKDDGWVVILNGDNFRFQEHYGDIINSKDSMLAKVFGKRKYSLMVCAMLLFDGVEREFELTEKRLVVVGLNRHCDGKIHKTGYEEILWEAKR